MARKRIVRPEVASHKPYLDGVAKNLADKLYGPDGPPRGTTFADLEELAMQLGRTISQEWLTRALARQAASAGSTPVPDDACCPSCHQPATAAAPEPRVVTTRAGVIAWDEPHRHCPRCRRSFFPSVPELGDRPPRRVAGGVGEGDLRGDNW